jgi:DNA-binding MarR family transcriptional regulator
MSAKPSVPESLTRVWVLPLPSLLEQVKNITLDEQQRRLAAEGFDGIRFRHGCVFRFIDEAGSRLTDLAERAGLTKQAIGEVIPELERLWYAERVAAANDGRAKIIRLTDRGRKAQSAAARILAEIEDRWSRLLQGRDDIDSLRRALEEIIRFERGPELRDRAH